MGLDDNLAYSVTLLLRGVDPTLLALME